MRSILDEGTFKKRQEEAAKAAAAAKGAGDKT